MKYDMVLHGLSSSIVDRTVDRLLCLVFFVSPPISIFSVCHDSLQRDLSRLLTYGSYSVTIF